ncbi:MAG: hypothetical protein FJ276_32765, partial [Planctomycetes bacterium]|nr:hypothetical protein [Planctomycetota bacterium]
DPSAKGRDDMIVHGADGTFALRKGPWKWIEGVPVDEVSAGARKLRRDQHRPQLYNLELDPAETKDVSAQHPEVVAELKSLLERYRDGGYSRELPPPGTKPAARAIATLAPAEGQPLLAEPLAALPSRPWTVYPGEWTARDGGAWAAPKAQADKPAQLKAALEFRDCENLDNSAPAVSPHCRHSVR